MTKQNQNKEKNLNKFKYEVAQEMGIITNKKNNKKKIDNSKQNR